MFVAIMLSYMDAQCFGVGALFGMIQDLGLYEVVSVEPLVTSTDKYSWASAITAFGSLVVSEAALCSKWPAD